MLFRSKLCTNLYSSFEISFFDINTQDILSSLTLAVQSLSKVIFPQIFKVTGDFISAIINLVIGFGLSYYILYDKDHLKKQMKGIIYAWLPTKHAKKFGNVLKLTSHTFSSFVSGQFIEIIILASICFIGMNIFGFEYSLLISVVIGITNIIPIVGPILGTIPSAIILFIDSPMSSVWFIVFIIVVQQIECNFIYPHVVGSHIGLPALWVAIGVVVGGGVFGIWGMAISLPTVSVIYSLTKEGTAKRLYSKFGKGFRL